MSTPTTEPSLSPDAVLVTTQGFLEKSMALGTLAVLDQPQAKRYHAQCAEAGITPQPLVSTLSFGPGGGEPRRLYVAELQTFDEVEKGILSDLCQGYGDARGLTVKKTGAQLKSQVAAFVTDLQATSVVIQARMGELLTAIGIAPPTADATLANNLKPLAKVRDSDWIEVPTYPWRETEWYDEGSSGSHPGIDSSTRDSLAPADSAVARAPKSAEDAARRQAYNELAWGLRDNFRDQAGAQRLTSVLPADGTYQLPLPLAMALRFTDKDGELAPSPQLPALSIPLLAAPATTAGAIEG